MVLQLDKWLVAFVIFGVFITGGILLIGDLSTNYNSNMNDSDFSDTYNTINETYELSRDIQDSALEEDVSEDSILSTLLKGSYKALKLLKNSFSIFTNVLTDVAQKLGVPSFLVDAAITVMIIMVIIALIYLFMRIIPT